MARRLKKSTNRLLLGVAGGISEYFNIDPAVVRAVFILLSFASGIGVLLYVALALLMPKSEAGPAEPLAVLKENLKTAPREAAEAGRRAVQALRGTPAEKQPTEGRSGRDGDETD